MPAGAAVDQPVGTDLLVAAARGTPQDPLSYLPTDAQAGPRKALANAGAIRHAAGSGSYLQTVQRLVPAGTATPDLPAATAGQRGLVAALPRDLRAPVAGLYAAVAKAADMLGTIPVSELRDELAAAASLNASYPQRAARAAGGYDIHAYPGGPARHVPGTVERFAGLSFGDATRHAIDADPQAALLLAAALDRYVPQIESARTATPQRTIASANGCDLVDQTPALCVASSSGDHTFTDDEMLLVALGGNNTYTDSAGAAPFLPSGTTQTIPVSVNVDVGGGNDRYVAPHASIADVGGSNPGLVMGQGAAVFGGIGISVNTNGDDVYSAATQLPASPDSTGAFHSADTVVQGAGATAYGLLFDGGGSDTFSVNEPTLHEAGVTLTLAQGAANGLGTGLGVLVDAGQDATHYAVQLGSDAGRAYAAMDLYVQGATEGDGTTGLLYDGGGQDSFAVTGTSVTDGLHSDTGFAGANYTVGAQGFAALGAGFLLEGAGTHSYALDITMNGGGDGLWGIGGQGAAALGSVAVLQDRGGPNSYDLEATMPVVRDVTVTDDCRCGHAALSIDGGAGDDATSLDSEYLGSPLRLWGQGASFNGVGIVDNAADATYRTVGTATMDVTLHDELTQPGAPASLVVHGFDAPVVVAQGAQELGTPAETPTAGILINRSGTASYHFLTSDAVHAAATSLHGPTPVVSTRTAYQWTAAAQGAGGWSDVPTNGNIGAVIDLGGPNDEFVARQDTGTTTDPDTGHGISPGGFWMPMQGAGDGGLIVATGANPSFVSSPANGVCPGSPALRGAGSWTSCGTDSQSRRLPVDADHNTFDFIGGLYGTGRAAGFAPQASAAAPTLTLSAPAAARDQSTVPVSVTLTDAGARPVAGAPVHLSLVAEWPIAFNQAPTTPYEDQWLDISETTLTTDAKGVATGSLPLDLTSTTGYPPSQLVFDRYWVMATYDGTAGLSSRHVMSDLALTDAGPGTDVPESPATVLLGACGIVATAGALMWRRRRLAA